MPEPVRQYVILHHLLAGSDHWDLMLDLGQTLATWQLTSDPAKLAAADHAHMVPARRISDHRRDYLDYEGPVSHGRGDVTRVDKGSYELIEQAPAGWTIRLEGLLLKGQFRVTATASDAEGVFHRAGD